MFVWLGVAVVIDAADGALARAVGVKAVLPTFDGTLLDQIIDYAGYVLVPAFALARSALLPQPVRWPLAAAICLASAYQFCRTDAKTEDHYFTGFPSYWNIMLFYLFLWKASPTFNAALVVGLLVLVFVPIRYVYPSRTVPFRRITLMLSLLWAVSVGAMLWRFPDPPRWLVHASTLYFAYYVGLSLYLMAASPNRPGTALERGA